MCGVVFITVPMQRPEGRAMKRMLLPLTLLAALVSGPARANLDQGLRYYADGAYKAAYKELLPAAEGGSPVAQYRIGRMYDDGNGVVRNYAKAREWYLKAARQGNADAQRDLGTLYAWGRGVDKSPEVAARWYRRAAERGDPEAQEALGKMYADGVGVPKDPVQAYKWLALSARGGGGKPGGDLLLKNLESHMTAAQLRKARGLVADFRPE